MGKPTGFLEQPRVLPGRIEPTKRIQRSTEFYLPQDNEVTRTQAGRCMDCGVPVCHQGCPLGNAIPDWNDAVYRDQWKRAYERLSATNNFPEFTGRLCPAPCESSCVLAINQDPVTIEQIEKEIIEYAFSHGWVAAKPPRERTGKRVAIVGSGPAGLAAAQQLNSVGHGVVVFEAAEKVGGLLRYGIPDFKMEKSVLDRRIDLLRKEGVEFQPNTRIGEAISWSTLKEDYDSVLIATGATVARELHVPGRELRGVYQAMEFLSRQNRIVDGSETREAAPHLDAKGKRVVILGGGDTGSDCLGTCHRQGAAHVTQIELFPAPKEHRSPDNPWPQWPVVLRTSSSHEEGGKREFAAMTTELVGDNGQLKSIRLVRVELVDGTLQKVPDSEFELAADMVLLAIGFTGPDTHALTADLGLELTNRGAIRTESDFQTSVPGIYCAGDAMRGASLIVWAIADGREAARAIDCALREDKITRLPTKGRDCNF